MVKKKQVRFDLTKESKLHPLYCKSKQVIKKLHFLFINNYYEILYIIRIIKFILGKCLKRYKNHLD